MSKFLILIEKYMFDFLIIILFFDKLFNLWIKKKRSISLKISGKIIIRYTALCFKRENCYPSYEQFFDFLTKIKSQFPNKYKFSKLPIIRVRIISALEFEYNDLIALRKIRTDIKRPLKDS